MRLRNWSFAVAAGLIACPSAALAQWLTFANETAARLNVASSIGATDPEEKDYAWADFDDDGDTDVIVVRKKPFTFVGGRQAVLMMNENGVLTDRTSLYGSAVLDVPGDLGMLQPVNNRTVFAGDVNNDGWTDIITAASLENGQPKHISHPRIYINLGNNGAGQWQGFRFENFRIPTISPGVPRFCGLGVGDVTGDGFVDLYFSDYDASGAANDAPPDSDTNDRLLINQGNGTFIDGSNGTYFQNPSWLSAGFGTNANIADVNGDGKKDIVRVNTLTPFQRSEIFYNRLGAGAPGFFNNQQIYNSNAPYFTSVADLNNDNRLDIVVSGDNVDNYVFNGGNSAAGTVNWTNFNLPSQTGGFGSNSVVADLDDDGWQDILIADVDIDIPGCNRTADILRNGGQAVVSEGSRFTYASNQLGFAENNLVGVFDFAVLDINGDGCLDFVAGKCNGTQVWIQQNCAIACEGDLDGDGDRDDSDLGILLASFGVNGGGDIDGDNDTDDSDLGILLAGFGVACPS